MTMREWIVKLDSFLALSDRELLTQAGTISHDVALAKAQSEFDKFRLIEDAKPQPVDIDSENALEQARQIAGILDDPRVRVEHPGGQIWSVKAATHTVLAVVIVAVQGTAFVRRNVAAALRQEEAG